MKKTNYMANQAMIAAIYTALSVCLSAVSYGPVQIRISEAMTLLPVFGIHNIWGVTIGCFMTNLIGFFTGANILGGLDMIFGTAATFAAALMSYAVRNIRFKNMPVLSAIPPIAVNAVVIGWELCIVVAGGFNSVVFMAQAVAVAAGQFLSCMVAGLLMVRIIENNKELKQRLSK
ncbi:MAG: QueT transporter family protein [Ruminococcaceae bacterium]|nr:QueT transporter family protein [Oscillospiraceae bacterium]